MRRLNLCLCTVCVYVCYNRCVRYKYRHTYDHNLTVGMCGLVVDYDIVSFVLVREQITGRLRNTLEFQWCVQAYVLLHLPIIQVLVQCFSHHSQNKPILTTWKDLVYYYNYYYHSRKEVWVDSAVVLWEYIIPTLTVHKPALYLLIAKYRA